MGDVGLRVQPSEPALSSLLRSAQGLNKVSRGAWPQRAPGAQLRVVLVVWIHTLGNKRASVEADPIKES